MPISDRLRLHLSVSQLRIAACSACIGVANAWGARFDAILAVPERQSTRIPHGAGSTTEHTIEITVCTLSHVYTTSMRGADMVYIPVQLPSHKPCLLIPLCVGHDSTCDSLLLLALHNLVNHTVFNCIDRGHVQRPAAHVQSNRPHQARTPAHPHKHSKASKLHECVVVVVDSGCR